MKQKSMKTNIQVCETMTLDTPPTEYIEENIYIDEKTIKNKDLIRIDMNLVQFPIFSKNTKRKVNQVVTYFFNQNRDTHITVTPRAGDYIPGELEERIFIVLMQIMKENNMAKKFIVTLTEIKDKLKMNTSRYGNIIKNSLLRLATSNYSFKNTLYSSEVNGIMSETIVTTIFSIRFITLSSKENRDYRDQIKDKRIKEIYEINMSEHFYRNIIQKGYMVYNGKTLLEIESSTARTIYMLIEKLRFNNLYLKLDTIFLIKRIPLKFERKNLPQTIKTLEKSFYELVSKGMIKSFKFLKETTWEKSEIEIIFDEFSNEEKQERFFKDRNDFNKLLVDLTLCETSHVIRDKSPVEEITEDIVLQNRNTVEDVNTIINLMPKKAKELKTLPKTIKEAIDEYGYDKVEGVAIYMKKQKVEKIRSYFLKALKEGWEINDDERVTINSNVEEKTCVDTDRLDVLNSNDILYQKYEALKDEEKDKIEKIVYKTYIEKCGIETKVQKLAFMNSKKIHICKYLEENPSILEVCNEKIDKLNEGLNLNVSYEIEEVKKIITDTIGLADMVFLRSEEEKKNILKNILKNIIPLVISRELTLEKLNEVIKKHIKF